MEQTDFVKTILSLIKAFANKKSSSSFIRREKEKIKTGCGNYHCNNCSLGTFLKFLPQSTSCFEDNNARKAIFIILISYKQDNELKSHLEKGRF